MEIFIRRWKLNDPMKITGRRENYNVETGPLS